MSNKQKNETGFGAVTVLLLLVVVVAVSAIGWLVYKNQHTGLTPTTNTSTTTKPTTQKPADEAEGQVIATADKKVQVTIPDTWHVIKDLNNPNADQVISDNRNNHLCDNHDPSGCSAFVPCLSLNDTVACTYWATFQPKALNPQSDYTWGMTVEKSDMTIVRASEQLMSDLSEYDTVDKNSDKLNGYDAFYVKVKGGNDAIGSSIDIHYIIKSDGYLVHFYDREQVTSRPAQPTDKNYSAYSADFAKIAKSTKLNF